MEKAIGGLPQYDSFEAMLAKMDEAGVEKVFITQCKMWSYRNKWMYMDTSSKSSAIHGRYPGDSSASPVITFSHQGVAAGNRPRGQEYGFKGVYIHIYGFDIRPRSNVPALCQMRRAKIPVSLQVGHVLEAMPSEHARPIYLDRIASDFRISKSSAPTRAGLGWRS
jgi:predicted TIM-barrel fold metal-dependent hydrolase